MANDIRIEDAGADSAEQVGRLVGELLAEIMAAVGDQAFRFDLAETAERLGNALERGTYKLFVALDGDHTVGFVTLFESFALYAEGAFGTIPEFYVGPEYRSGGVGHRLLERVRQHAVAQGWKRLEVTTPPLPAFDRTLSFYRREGFSIAGGRKLKAEL